MKRFRILIAITGLSVLAPLGSAQSVAAAGISSSSSVSSSIDTLQPQPDLTYKRPTEKTKLRNYFFDTFGPYPILGAAISGAINQADSTPPEWGQGFGVYGERVGSNFGIAMVTTTTRYTLAKAFHEDTLYYRCECKGVARRLGHALISTVTGRHGDDGYRRFSFAALAAPYAGSMTAVYGWYPSRYGAEDGLRMGNYTVLAFAGENIVREFIYGGPHTLFAHPNRSAPSGTDPVVASKP